MWGLVVGLSTSRRWNKGPDLAPTQPSCIYIGSHKLMSCPYNQPGNPSVKYLPQHAMEKNPAAVWNTIGLYSGRCIGLTSGPTIKGRPTSGPKLDPCGSRWTILDPNSVQTAFSEPKWVQITILGPKVGPGVYSVYHHNIYLYTSRSYI